MWDRLKPLFDAVMAQSPAQRSQIIAQLCGDDAELRSQLQAMLDAQQAETAVVGPLPAPAPGAPLHDAPALLPGQLLLQRFRIVRRIGHGGMGDVYEATDLELNQTLALKTIRGDFARYPGALTLFKTEVQLARRVSGPHVCRIHEFFLAPARDDSAAFAFLTMEMLHGETLAARLRRPAAFSPADARRIALDICDGLTAIHHAGIIHRDLKPRNVMLVPRPDREHAVLMDFGVAYDSQSTAREETMAGTPDAMAPEQFEGRPTSPATDVYALGVVLYEVFSGTHPFSASTPVAAAARRASHPRPPSSFRHDLPRHWDRIVARCLEYEPQRRFQTPAAVAGALLTRPFHPANIRHDHPRLFFAACALPALALAWAGFRFWQIRQYNHPNAEAARWYQAGVASLREACYFKATRELGMAAASDDRFVMAHARLAEAWSHLDFDGKARSEMLIASTGENHLPPLDHLYLDAIRATLNGDLHGALDRYRIILDRLPASRKDVGYIDLGMAWERLGDPQDALHCYTRASGLNPDNPAPFLHTGMLESRQNLVQKANEAFDHADHLYNSETNLDGMAELAFQRGYLANEREANDEANADLTLARADAQRLQNVQLEIRALTQLSSVAYNTSHDDQAIAFAQRAIQLARDNQLDDWAADGLVRLASVDLYHDFNQADAPLQEAFQILQRSPQARVEAMANLTLGGLRLKQNRTSEALEAATRALAYYRRNGNFREGAQSSLIIARAQRSRGQIDEALKAGYELVDLSRQAGQRNLQTQAEELLGSVYLLREDYSQALDHLNNAFTLAGDGTAKPYEAAYEAEVLNRIGRFADAERMLVFTLPTNPTIPVMHAQAFIGERKYAQAEALAAQSLQRADLQAGDRNDLTMERALALALGGHAPAALAALHSIPAPDNSPGNEGAVAAQELSTATVLLAAGEAASAYDPASHAESYFSAAGLKDSGLRSALIAAQAARLRHDAAHQKLYAQKAVDILKALRQTWSPSVFHSYSSRSDLAWLSRGIVQLSP
jgi:tetratricopeptide (TPR) repeat protein